MSNNVYGYTYDLADNRTDVTTLGLLNRWQGSAMNAACLLPLIVRRRCRWLSGKATTVMYKDVGFPWKKGYIHADCGFSAHVSFRLVFGDAGEALSKRKVDGAA